MHTEVLDQINKQLAEFETKKSLLYKALRKDLFEVFRPVFDTHIGVDEFSWDQYSPYFNDGDECVFSVRADSDYALKVNGVSVDDYEDDPNSFEITPEGAWQAAEMASDIIYSLPEDFLREMFGNHVTVAVHRDGKMVTKECDHD